jgi:hypothetical protein
MKKHVWKVVACGAALLAASGAIGQANQTDAIAEIPFAFTVASYTFHSGFPTLTTRVWLC